MEKPANIVGRDRQWRTVERFLFEGGQTDGPLRLGLVSGRRRTGKTQLLTAACEAVGGFYIACVQDEGDRAARARFTAAMTEHAGLGTVLRGEPESWDRLLRAVLETAARTAPAGSPGLVVIDEFPYAMAHAPQLPSLIQHLYDDSQNGRAPGGRLVLCGSALSVMHSLLSGTEPLRGRAMLDMRLSALDYREAARLWGIREPDAALRVHACVGGIPGYRPLMASVPTTVADFDHWVVENLLAVDVGVFTRTEVDYLLREDPRITARAVYYDVLSAVAAGAHTPSKIGAAIGRDNNAVRYPIDVLESAGYLTKTHDLLRSRKPVITVSDPVIRFDRLITAPYLGQLQLGRAEQVWRAAAPTFRSNILGPHFEELAREWVRRFAPDELGRPEGLGEVGFASVQDHSGRAKHEIDVIALDGRRVRLLGEAKATLARRGLPDLERLDGIRGLLEREGYDTSETVIALFSTTGFTSDLEQTAATRPDLELVDLDRLYQGTS
ncbi:ATPase AAA [Planomonospora parontospora subsp. parontospora]|uniref:ATPase AAA n=2 Tax=Planomonospora parontospora TaxID=58119 RepID=A0AA37BEJ0_9ACTN|nr:ATP-binding protein [Planomonospora parontospora]GGK58572.1 ATPase AAA [Planomonospora parontospora]GII07917.1 ATPase AAA [Planomonospora parontospora subsp. parontospora]